jgi:ABC-2 type transport system permease protein
VTTIAPTAPHPLGDSLTMLRRNLLHARRYPTMTVSTILMPVTFLLLFGFVFGDAMGRGLGAAGTGGRSGYIAYITPGILAMTAAAGSMSTAVAVCSDMTEGIIARFRTMAIVRSSVLTGHVVGSMILNMLTLVLVVGVALLAGFRADASGVEWLATIGLLGGLTLALTWLSVALGLVSKTPEGASNIVLPLMYLPLVGSGFVPVDSMPGALRWFAANQPFSPIIETLRGLLTGMAIGSDGAVAVAWCVGIAVGGFAWSRSLFNRDPVR